MSHEGPNAYCKPDNTFCHFSDIFYIASLKYNSLSTTDNSGVTLKCFHESFHRVFSDCTCLCDLPANNKPVDGPGILINLLGKERWQPFATWVIKIINKCLTEGTLQVEGLVNMPFTSAACSLLCYGDACLHIVSPTVDCSVTHIAFLNIWIGYCFSFWFYFWVTLYLLLYSFC